MRILVCRPDFFDVEYVINPWMEGQIGRVDRPRALGQWGALVERLARVASLEQVRSTPGCPDMCFTANAGLVADGLVVPARFRTRERRPEEEPFGAWFGRAGFDSAPLPDGDPFEGEGDALFQPGEPLLWAGYGMRTAFGVHLALGRTFGVEVVSLRLVDPRFYHLDTCLAPLPGGRVIYFPGAFDERSLRALEHRIGSDKRIAVTDADAMAFACNALRVDERLFLNAASPGLVRALAAWGFEACVAPVGEFLKAGGGVKCLSLVLDQAPFASVSATPTADSPTRVSEAP